MKNVLIKLYLFVFFDDFMLIYPFYMLMFEERGISAIGISMLLVVWAVTSILMEIPSGALADKYSRKWVIVWGQAVRFVGYGFWLFMPNFVGFIIGFIAWGLKESITSGTFEALLYDELKNLDKESEFTKILGRVKAIVFTAIFLASVLAAIVIDAGYKIVLLASIASAVLSCFFMAILPETRRYRAEDHPSFIMIFKQGVSYAVKKKKVLIIISFLAIIFGLAGSFEEFWPLLGNEIGLSKESIAIMFGIIALPMAFGSTIAHRFEKVKTSHVYLANLLAGFLVLIGTLTLKKWIIILIAFFFLVHQTVYTVMQGKLQRMIPSRIRATVSSMNGFFSGGLASILFIIFGYIADVLSYRASFIVFSVLVTLICFIYFNFSLVAQKTKNYKKI
ncbi:MAG: MFS transporter [Acidobacteria bacterium]|nr:MFS transporter [Acidobacteriota bacterium]